MNRIGTVIVLLMVFSTTLLGQSFITKETASKKALKTLEKSQECIKSGKYEEGLAMLEKALSEHPNFVDAQFLKAIVYYDTKQFQEALTAYKNGLSLAPNYAAINWYQAGITAIKAEDYGYAVEALQAFLDRGDRNQRRLERAESYLNQAKFAKEAVANPVPFKWQRLSNSINSEEAAEVLPALTADGNYLVFTRFIDGQEDFYYSRKEAGKWLPASPLVGVNTDLNEGAQCISADGRFLVFTACNRKNGYGRCDLYYATLQGGTWTPSKNMGEPINTNAWESTPSISANGQTLFFASDRSGGQGGRDIWMSTLTSQGWSSPKNMGPVINSNGDEQSPFIHADGKTLYFMSNGRPGMGGFDLYVSRLGADGHWGKPQNLGYPINTTGDEGAMIVSLDGKRGYFASDRMDNSNTANLKGNADLYTFELYEAIRPTPATYFSGQIVDAISREPLEGIVEIMDVDAKERLLAIRSDLEGKVLACLPAGKDYALNVTKEGYLFYSDHFALQQSTIEEPFIREIPLSPIMDVANEKTITKRQPIILRNVFFETGSAALLTRSETELNHLKELLENNPTLQIQINGHTDNVGKPTDNQVLSTARAEAVYTYLIEHGITKERLSFEGYGETLPVATNETPEGRQLNRRTEFVVVN